jgi:hypothetical protein
MELRHELRVASARSIRSSGLNLIDPEVQRVIRDLTYELDNQLKPITTRRLDWQSLESLIQDAVKLDALF